MPCSARLLLSCILIVSFTANSKSDIANDKGSAKHDDQQDRSRLCLYGEWSKWSGCSVPCNRGHTTRVRKLITQNSDVCDHSARELRTCNSRPCPVDCDVTTWLSWSKCDTDDYSAIGGKYRARHIIRSPLYGGRGCPPLTQYTSCFKRTLKNIAFPAKDYSKGYSSDDFNNNGQIVEANSNQASPFQRQSGGTGFGHSSNQRFEELINAGSRASTRDQTVANQNLFKLGTVNQQLQRVSSIDGVNSKQSTYCLSRPDGKYPVGSCERMYVVCRSRQLAEDSCRQGYLFSPFTRECVLAQQMADKCGGR